MSKTFARYRRTIVVVGFALLLVLGFGVLTNQGTPQSLNSGTSQTQPTATPSPSGPTPAPAVKGDVVASIHALGSQRFAFVYTVHNRGNSVIAGFQINGSQANLYNVRGPSGWNPFGSGVCHGHYPGVLIYWSTGVGGIAPHGSARFTFDAKSKGTASLSYSLSQRAGAIFGHLRGPRPSSQAAPGTCRASV